MRIGELANRAGLTTETIRFYEKQGLLGDSAHERTESNYRVYDEAMTKRLETIGAAKQLGFSLSEILELSRLWESGQLDHVAQERALKGKLLELRDKRAALEHLQTVVRRKLSVLRKDRRQV
jgi:DNA-binding transcriptional MerR regulator